MLIDFSIDTRNIEAAFNLSDDQIDDLMQLVVHDITAAFAHYWENETKILSATKDQYRRSIKVAKRGRFTGVAYLDPASWIVNAVELGVPGFDMKPGMLNSPKAKTNKQGGKYLIIPFRFATPTAIGESEAFTAKLPPEIHKIAKEKDGPLALSDIPEQYHIPKSAELRQKAKSMNWEQAKEATADHEKTSIYQGLQKRDGGYMNFRVVSENSEPGAWQHPGIEARELARKALANYEPQIPTQVDGLIDDYLSNLGF